jgi:hypothetical protein
MGCLFRKVGCLFAVAPALAELPDRLVDPFFRVAVENGVHFLAYRFQRSLLTL